MFAPVANKLDMYLKCNDPKLIDWYVTILIQIVEFFFFVPQPFKHTSF